jgi:hypothetical protein
MLGLRPSLPKLAVRNEEAALQKLRHAADTAFSQHQTLDTALCQLFGARALPDRSHLSATTWFREFDDTILAKVAHLLAHHEQISILEVGAGTTYGQRDLNFGVPGLSRIIKRTFPEAVRIVACDREGGCDIFFTLPNGTLFHDQYRDDRPPRTLDHSSWKNSSTLEPLSQSQIKGAVNEDLEFRKRLLEYSEILGHDLGGVECQIFLRPRIDSEVEAMLHGIRALDRMDYRALPSDLPRRGIDERFTFIFGRHLCPVGSPWKAAELQKTLLPQLKELADYSFVQFDNSFNPDGVRGSFILSHSPSPPALSLAKQLLAGLPSALNRAFWRNV